MGGTSLIGTIRFLARDIWKMLQLASFRSKWRKLNKHNFTVPNNIFPIERVTVGRGTYADLNVYSYRNKDERLSIGHFCSIASDVIFILSGEHRLSSFSTYPFEERYFGVNGTALCKGPIIVEDDVWIGVRATILSGVTIGKGAVIGAGSLVNKNVPPYSIYAGTKLIGKRFDGEISRRLIDINFARMDIGRIEKIAGLEINVNSVEEVMKCLDTITR